MYLNDKYADCTAAAAAHVIQNWRAHLGEKRAPSEAEVLAFYEHFTKPGPENGCAMLTVLKYWRTTGFSGERIAAFSTLKYQERTQIKHAVHLFGACYIGLQLPKFIMGARDGTEVAWEIPPAGRLGHGELEPDGGHCVPIVAYDAHYAHVVTWGRLRPMSWSFYEKYADEAYAVLNPRFIEHGKRPAGFDLEQLERDVAELSKAA